MQEEPPDGEDEPEPPDGDDDPEPPVGAEAGPEAPAADDGEP